MSEPLEIKQDDINDTITIAGIKFAKAVFRTFENPNEKLYYRIKRDGDNIIMNTFTEVGTKYDDNLGITDIIIREGVCNVTK